MAQIQFNGRLGKDPELKTSNNGKEYARLSVAWQERQKDRTGEWHDGPTVWVSVTTFGRQAGNAVSSLSKGDHVAVSGRIQPELWSSDRGEETVFTVAADSVAPTLFFQRTQVGKDDQQSGGGWGGSAGGGNPGGGWNNANSASGGPSGGSAGDPWNSGPKGGFGGAQDDEQPPF